jgi:hypothetical protein
LVVECEKPTCILEHTLTVRGEATVDASTVSQSAGRIKESQTEGQKFIKTT